MSRRQPVMHPRLKLYPWSANYAGMRMEFRPFVMFMNPADYRSVAVNTDRLGFRRQYDPWDKPIDLDRLDAYEACDVFVGNSAAFGVDASSDKATIAAALNRLRCRPGETYIPLINLAVRGATLQQELATFLVARKFLPPVRNIVSLSGIIEAMYCIMQRAMLYPDWGAVNNEMDFFHEMEEKYCSDQEPFNRWLQALHGWIDTRLRHSTVAHILFQHYCKLTHYDQRLAPMPAPRPVPSLNDGKREAVLARVANDLDTWSALARGIGARMHYVLQPVIGWTKKRLAPTEQKIMAVDRINIPSLQRYAHQGFHRGFAADLRRLCQAAGIDFHDANLWFDAAECDGRSLFTDVCHMSDEGSEILAQYLAERLCWNNRIGETAGPVVAVAGQ
jgi:hypothetical protein